MLAPQEMVKLATLHEELRQVRSGREDGFNVHYRRLKGDLVLRSVATAVCLLGLLWSVSHLI